jgi:Mn2+/Fe2+ NRAMP family transporter
LFGIGLLASALIAIPVLAETSAYVVSEMFGWVSGIDKKLWEAIRFYTTLIATLLVGSAIGLAGISPIRLLFFGSIVGGLATPITLALMMLIAAEHTAMAQKPVNSKLLISGGL